MSPHSRRGRGRGDCVVGRLFGVKVEHESVSLTLTLSPHGLTQKNGDSSFSVRFRVLRPPVSQCAVDSSEPLQSPQCRMGSRETSHVVRTDGFMLRNVRCNPPPAERMRDDDSSDEDESAPLVQAARPKVHWTDSASTKGRNTFVAAQLACIWCILLYIAYDSLAPPKAPRVEPLPGEPSPPPASRSAVLFSSAGGRLLVPALAVPPNANATAATAAAAAASSAACPSAWVGDGVCQLGCAAEPHGDRGDCRAASAECDAQVGLGFLTQVRQARAPLCRDGRSSAWLHDVPDQGCRCATCRTKLAVLENVELSWDEAGGAEPKKKRAQVPATQPPPQPSPSPSPATSPSVSF